jgi:predicted DCC family thiol-disulfide oxidoreductase YuxK
MADTQKLTVFYDGACPLCEREISFYRQREGADSVAWVDVSGFPEGEVAPSLSKDQALARFHVLNADGALISGGAAFAELWTVLPSFRLWGKLFQARPFVWVLNRVYDRFLRIRPRIQSIVAGRQTLRDDTFPSWPIRDLRSDHAGETGASAAGAVARVLPKNWRAAVWRGRILCAGTQRHEKESRHR